MIKKSKAIIAIFAALTMAACGQQVQTFSAADGSVSATLKKGNQWSIKGPDGREVVADCDSMRVVEVSEDGHPMTVCYYRGKEQIWLQYYSTMVKRSEGSIVDGRREGRWTYYHPDGSVQSECTFVGGVEEGPYKVFREGGIPYYIGQYSHGERTGTWEVYNNDGTLAATKEY